MAPPIDPTIIEAVWRELMSRGLISPPSGGTLPPNGSGTMPETPYWASKTNPALPPEWAGAAPKPLTSPMSVPSGGTLPPSAPQTIMDGRGLGGATPEAGWLREAGMSQPQAPRVPPPRFGARPIPAPPPPIDWSAFGGGVGQPPPPPGPPAQPNRTMFGGAPRVEGRPNLRMPIPKGFQPQQLQAVAPTPSMTWVSGPPSGMTQASPPPSGMMSAIGRVGGAAAAPPVTGGGFVSGLGKAAQGALRSPMLGRALGAAGLGLSAYNMMQDQRPIGEQVEANQKEQYRATEDIMKSLGIRGRPSESPTQQPAREVNDVESGPVIGPMATTGDSRYRMKSGDTLYDIAGAMLSSGGQRPSHSDQLAMARKIAERSGVDFDAAHKLQVGQELDLGGSNPDDRAMTFARMISAARRQRSAKQPDLVEIPSQPAAPSWPRRGVGPFDLQ